MIYYAFDLYPRTDPLGARLVRFTKFQSAEYRGQANGSGAGQFVVRATNVEADSLDPDGLQYVRVVEINDAVVDGATLSGFEETVVGGFFTESGQFEVLTETSTKLLTWGGAGPLNYLQRAVMDADSWIDDPFIGTDPQPDGTWPLHLAGTGNELGAILWRILHELEEPGRHQNPLPAMSLGFTHLLDSNGAAWVRTTGDFVAQVADGILLPNVKRLMEMGLYVEVDADTFEVRAFEPETHRRDRTGGAWAADVVRFQAPIAGDISTGNIKSNLTRALEAKVRRNALLTGSNDTWLWVLDPTVDVPWEGGKIIEDEAGTSLLKAGEAELAARGDAGDSARLRIMLGDDQEDGRYRPFVHVLLDDLVTVHTGTGQWDYNEAEFPVAALTIAIRPGGDWDAWADLGSTYLSMAERAFQAQPVGAHTHPPNPRLCPSADLLRGLTSLKGSGAQASPAAPLTNANDGNDTTPWGSGEGEPLIGVAGEWWAADLGSPGMVGTYRIRQQGGGNPDVQNVATTVGIYGTTDAGLWAALPASGKLTDPAALGWLLLATFSGALAFSDVRADFTPAGAQYVIFWAEAGGTLDWDVETFELWSHVGTSRFAARCDHLHHASMVDFTPTGTIAATDVQAAIAEVAAEAAGSSLTVEDEGTPLATDAATLNFVGAGVTATGAGGTKTITVPGGGAPTGAAGGDLSGTYPNPSVVDDSHSHTSATAPGGGGARLWHLEREHRLRIVGHRGDINLVDGYPENTLEGVRQAALRGADGVEFDVIRSSEGTWHLMHDNDVSRTTDGTGWMDATTDAGIAALNIDGGYGYDAGRHGTSLNVPLLDDVMDALRPYNSIAVLHLAGLGDDIEHTEIANYIVANDISDRVIVLVASLTGAAEVKAVDPNIQTQALTPTTDDPHLEPDVDQWLANHADLTSLTTVTTRAPEQVWSIAGVSEIPDDETAWIQEAWDYGAVGFMTNALPEALACRERITMRGRYEPVVDDPGGGPEIVFDAGDIVMQWVPN